MSNKREPSPERCRERERYLGADIRGTVRTRCLAFCLGLCVEFARFDAHRLMHALPRSLRPSTAEQVPLKRTADLKGMSSVQNGSGRLYKRWNMAVIHRANASDGGKRDRFRQSKPHTANPPVDIAPLHHPTHIAARRLTRIVRWNIHLACSGSR